MSEIKIIENKSELGAGTRGASLGVGALQVVARQRKENFFGDYERFLVDNHNDMLDYATEYAYAKRIDGLVDIYQNAADIISFVCNNGDFPLALSGDHSCAIGTVSGIKKAYPNKRLGVIWIDAHADLHTPYTTPSGNVHGMPLAALLGEDNLESKINTPNADVVDMWKELKEIGVPKAKLNANDLVFISVRATEKPENEFISRNNIKNYSVDELRQKGMEIVSNEIKEKLADCDIIYVSFDVDSMDSILISKGTGTPVENGLTEEEANYFVCEFASWEKTCCVEMVEINPCLDNKINRMAEVAYNILGNCAKVIDNKI